MRTSRGAFWALALVGGWFMWRNRFAIQRQLEAMGVRTPILDGTVGDSARSIAAKVSGKMDRGATIAEHAINKEVSNY